jgi:hypothetical protein
MKYLAMLGLALAIVCPASTTFAAPPGGDPPGNLAAAVAELQEENTTQQEQIDQLVGDLAAESEARVNEDNFLQEQIGDEIVARENEDGFLQQQIDQNDADIGLLFEADAQQQNQIDDNEQRIAEVQSDVNAISIQGYAYVTEAAGVDTTNDPNFLPIANTFVVFTANRPTDAAIHFCAQIDNQMGGRTLARVLVDGTQLAEPSLAPGPIMSWDSEVPTTKCMIWIASGLAVGEHEVSVEWAHDIGPPGSYSRTGYRTLVVYY